jgi:hypothetical protein
MDYYLIAISKAMLLSKSLEILLRGALASYLLLFALDLKTRPQHWTPLIAANLNYFLSLLSTSSSESANLPTWFLNYYCQWLVLSSLLIVSGLRTGKLVGGVALVANWAVCWSEMEVLFVGKRLIIQDCTQ